MSLSIEIPSEVERAAASPKALRARTEALVLHALRLHGYANARDFRDTAFAGLSREALAEAAGVSRPSVHEVVRTFSNRKRDAGNKNRRARPLQLGPDAGYALGVDFGRRHARVALADLNGRLFGEREGFERIFSPAEKPGPLLDWAAGAIDELLKASKVKPSEIMGLGISRTAPVSSATGKAHASGLANREWRDVNVADGLKHRREYLRDLHAITDNDANLSALAEHTFGAARDTDDFVYVKWSDGVAVGMILSGQPYRGHMGYAGQVGHLLIDWRDRRGYRDRSDELEECEICRKKGCLETRVGVLSLARALHVPILGEARVADQLLKVARSNSEAHKRLDYSAYLTGEAIASVVDTLNPSCLVLGGSLGSSIHDHSELMASFRAALDEHVMGFARNIEIRRPELRRSAVHGATLRVLSDRLVEWARQPDRAGTLLVA